MSGRYPKSSRVRKSPSVRGKPRRKVRQIERQALAQSREVQLPLNVAALVELTREALSSFAVEMGLKVAQCLLEDEVKERCGERHERQPNRQEQPNKGSRNRSSARGERRWDLIPRIAGVDGATPVTTAF